MRSLSPLSLQEWLSALAGPRAVPAGGALALVTLAGAAALAVKVVRRAGGDESAFEGFSALFLPAAEEDARAYLAAAREGGAALAACLEAGLGHLEAALALVDGLGGAFGGMPDALAADLAAAERLARAGARTLLVNLAVNLAAWSGFLGEEAAAAVRERLDAARRALEEP